MDITEEFNSAVEEVMDEILRELEDEGWTQADLDRVIGPTFMGIEIPGSYIREAKKITKLKESIDKNFFKLFSQSPDDIMPGIDMAGNFLDETKPMEELLANLKPDKNLLEDFNRDITKLKMDKAKLRNKMKTKIREAVKSKMNYKKAYDLVTNNTLTRRSGVLEIDARDKDNIQIELKVEVIDNTKNNRNNNQPPKKKDYYEGNSTVAVDGLKLQVRYD